MFVKASQNSTASKPNLLQQQLMATVQRKRIPFTSHTFQNVINFERANDLEFPFELHSECIFNVDLFRQKKCMDN